jgi:hypothetical protein
MPCLPEDSSLALCAAISLTGKCRHGFTVSCRLSFSVFIPHIDGVQSKMLLPTLAMFRNRRLFLRFVAAGLCLGCLLFWTFSPTSSSLHLATSGISTPRSLPCHSLPGTKETLFILRIGATEIADRLPAHISSSLRCFPNHVVFSDFEERSQDENVLDALEFVDPQIIANNQGFELYRRVQRDGRAGLAPSELSGSEAQALSDSGHAEIPGWKLDKWKFVPMVNRTLYEFPDMEWYVFNSNLLTPFLHRIRTFSVTKTSSRTM